MLVINFFAGPGTGKSTHAAMLFATLKTQNINAELVQEYAKEKTWIRDSKTLEVQPYIAGKQFYRQARLRHDLDVVVTDSPLIQGLAYSGYGVTESFKKWMVEAYHLFDNVNIFLERDSEHHTFNPKGRWQDETAAIQKDHEILGILNENGISYYKVKVGEDSHRAVYEIAMRELEERKRNGFTVLITADQPNSNGTVISREAIEKSLPSLLEKSKNSTLIGQVEHPAGYSSLLTNVTHIIKDLEFDGFSLKGKINFLETARGRGLKGVGLSNLEFRPRTSPDGKILSFDAFLKG